MYTCRMKLLIRGTTNEVKYYVFLHNEYFCTQNGNKSRNKFKKLHKNLWLDKLLDYHVGPDVTRGITCNYLCQRKFQLVPQLAPVRIIREPDSVG
jgi:hypothetical protein